MAEVDAACSSQPTLGVPKMIAQRNKFSFRVVGNKMSGREADAWGGLIERWIMEWAH